MEDVDFSITILSNGETVEISPQSVFRPLSAEGFACGDYGVTTDENMLIDGSYIHSRRLNARLLVISFEIFPICESEKYRSRLIHFLNPKNDFTVTVIRNGVKRSIDCVLKSSKIIQPTLRSAVTAEIAFLCPMPYFADDREEIYSNSTVVPLFTFPFNSVKGYGITMGKSYRTNVFNVENYGDTNIGVTVSIYASGKVVNPKISCGDQYIKITDSMKNGDVYTVSTEPGNKRIEKNGVGNFCFDRSSVFFSVPRGSSTITITADSGADFIRSVLSYSERYLGI